MMTVVMATISLSFSAWQCLALDGADGRWAGTVGTMSLSMSFATRQGTVHGLISIPDARVLEYPMSSATLIGQKLAMEIKTDSGKLTAT